jgi:hypothetical protein
MRRVAIGVVTFLLAIAVPATFQGRPFLVAIWTLIALLGVYLVLTSAPVKRRLLLWRRQARRSTAPSEPQQAHQAPRPNAAHAPEPASPRPLKADQRDQLRRIIAQGETLLSPGSLFDMRFWMLVTGSRLRKHGLHREARRMEVLASSHVDDTNALRAGLKELRIALAEPNPNFGG